MKKTDEQLANELDLFLTARLNGQPLPQVSEELLNDIAFVDSLLETTAQLEPEQLFLADLQAQLAAEAVREQQKTKPVSRPALVSEKRPFWENIILTVKEQFTMKRTVFALGAALALFVFAFLAWSAFQGLGAEEPGVIVENPTTESGGTAEPVETAESGETTESVEVVEPGETAEPVEPTKPVEIAELPVLPSLSNASLGGGFGGGGDGTVAEGSAGPDIGLTIYNPLSGTQFVMNATLPIEPASAVVYQQPGGSQFSLDDVSRLASLFGLSGPVYLEQYYIEEGSEWTPSPVYQVFDGAKNLAVGTNNLYYYDEAASVFIGVGGDRPMPFEQALPIAEAFLQQTGLADFPYRIMSQNGYDVEVRRLVDGREVIFPEIQISVNESGEIWSFSYIPLSGLNALGDYPLRSAEASWQYMLENGVDYQTVFYQSYPAEPFPASEPPAVEEFPYWQRTFEAGDEVTLYSYPMVFEAVNGDAAPRIILDYFLLSGPADQLEAITEYVGKQIHVEAVAGEMVGNRQLMELVSWEPIEKEYTFREGTIQIGEGEAVLVMDDGETVIIPDVPADLNNGERVYVSGWLEEGDRGEEAIFNWQSMGVTVVQPEVIEGEPETMPVDGPFVPFTIEEVTIDEVTLEYAVLSIWDEETQTSSYILQPVWQYSGLTNNGDIIEIFVQAIEAEFVENPANQ